MATLTTATGKATAAASRHKLLPLQKMKPHKGAYLPKPILTEVIQTHTSVNFRRLSPVLSKGWEKVEQAEIWQTRERKVWLQKFRKVDGTSIKSS